ncbi:MAG TPA: hypothetical protein VLD67_10205 [Vicinamibacterales bacterium]|nr:hypothetical protein [Vicinamibacterales bacterium]
MKRLLIGLGVLAMLAPAALAAAQDEPASKTELTFAEPTVVGSSTLSPGRYKFTCRMIDGDHVMIVTSVVTGKEVARVQCKQMVLDSKVQETEYRSVRRGEVKVVTDVRIKGESFAHRLAPPVQ